MHNSKVCFKCDVEKPLSEFYKHGGMADGHVNKCKGCNKYDVRENRASKIDYYLEYDKQRANIPKRVAGRERYVKTEDGKVSHRRARLKWSEANQIKRSASHLVGNYVRDGKLIKAVICEDCGSPDKRLHGHHDDYAYPLSVRWLCSKCHTGWHREHGAGLNG